ncbi:hypothetical protein ACSVIJ_04655 [Pseudomonas sp. NCHU5208]|uniref:hypothetical protein n=1 Tax=unclassified Pseudomonas TaxID=196821 RepID=UPI003F9E14B1
MILKALFSTALLSGLACALLIGIHDGVVYDGDRLQAMMIAAGRDAPVNAYLMALLGGLVGGVLTMCNQPKLAVAAVAAFGVPFYLGICVLLTGPLLNSPSLLGAQTAIALCVLSTVSFLAVYALFFVNLFSGLWKLLPGVLAGFRR